MKKFETTIEVYNQGCSPAEAGEKAKSLFDMSEMEQDMLLTYDPTVMLHDCCLTVFRIINYGTDLFEAGDRAGDIIDISQVKDDTYIYCFPTREVSAGGDDIGYQISDIRYPCDFDQNLPEVNNPVTLKC